MSVTPQEVIEGQGLYFIPLCVPRRAQTNKALRFEWHCGLVLELEYKWLISASELGHNTEESSRLMTAHIFGNGEGAIWITAVWSDTRCSIVGDWWES